MKSDLLLLDAGGKCPAASIIAANLVLATLNALLATVAFVQLLRLYLHSQEKRWTRQKVFHCLIGTAAAGYCIYFVLNVVAACARWVCWFHACGFVAMGIPQIIFLATFLLLLSFWVDLCHQATDKEDDDEEEEDPVASDDAVSVPGHQETSYKGPRRWFYYLRRLRIRGRQKFVIAVVMLIFFVTIAFAFVIWIGKGDNPIDSDVVAQIYSDSFALVVFFAGGGLAGYGLTLYMRMSRLRTVKKSADLRKVAGLAVVSVVCFSVRALVVLLRDIKVLNYVHSSKVHALVLFLYSFIGEVIPSAVVLWVMRDVPNRSTGAAALRPPAPLNGYQQALAQEQALLEQWIVPEDLDAIVMVSRSRKIRSLGRSDSEAGSTSNSA